MSRDHGDEISQPFYVLGAMVQQAAYDKALADPQTKIPTAMMVMLEALRP